MFQPSPDLTRKFLYQEFAFTTIMLAVALKAPVINMALFCLTLRELMKMQPLPQIAYNVLAPHNSYSWSKQGLILFPGIDACKMNIIWRQWIILPRPPNVFVANNFGLLFKHDPAKWMVWIQKSLYPSSILPHTLWYNVSPWSVDICFISLCKVPCVLQNRT